MSALLERPVNIPRVDVTFAILKPQDKCIDGLPSVDVFATLGIGGRRGLLIQALGQWSVPLVAI